MKIQDLEAVHQVADMDQLDSIMDRKYKGYANTFWISHGDDKYPVMLIFMNGDQANIQYYPREGHAGLTSIGNILGTNGEGVSSFVLNRFGEMQEIDNSCIISSHEARTAAREFMNSRALPTSVTWLNLGD
jgi:hypothetical protein